jgi:chemotaxis protein histidine kinase CheA
MANESTQTAAREDDEAGVHRLRDMVVEEVSLVDRAANKRRFLVVKRSDDMADDAKDGTEVAPGPTAVAKAKKKPAAGEQDDETTDEEKRKKPAAEDDTEKARRRAAPADDGEDDNEEDDTKKARRAKPGAGEKPAGEEDDAREEKRRKANDTITMPASVKEAILRMLTEALERLMSVANRVKEAEETDEELDEPVPEDIGTEVAAIAELLGGLDESYSTDKSKRAVAKAGRRMAKDRLDRFQKAMELLAEILKELTNGKEPAPTAGAAEAGVRKRDGAPAPAALPGMADLIAGITELTRVVKRQEEELGRLRQARGVSNVIPVDAARRREADEVSWPLDMNRPISRDKVKKEVSFFDE